MPEAAQPRKRGFRAGIPPVPLALIVIALIALGVYFAFTGANPFAHPYKLVADAYDADNMTVGSPVRMAGIDVGQVTGIEPLPGRVPASRITMTINANSPPIHSDAQLKIRSRLFLEGSYFVDVNPGSPSTPTLPSGATIPPGQVTGSVQLSQVLTALQADTRRSLQSFLKELSKGFSSGGAEGLRASAPYWASAYRNLALANQGTLGTQPHDLSGVVRGQGNTFGALSADPAALRDLIVHFNTTAEAFARENVALERTIPALRDVVTVGTPALVSLNGALPSLSRFSRDALPGTRSSVPTLDASIPFVAQADALVSPSELRGLVHDLRPTVPALARLNVTSVPLLEQTRLLSSCQNQVVLPFSKAPIPDPDFPANSGQPFYKQAPRGLVGLAGESRTIDGISPLFHILLQTGGDTVVEPGENGVPLFGTTAYPPEGSRPAMPASRPQFRPDVPCETQRAPDLGAPLGGPQKLVTPVPLPVSLLPPSLVQLDTRSNDALSRLEDSMRRMARGQPYVSPVGITESVENRERQQQGLPKFSMPTGAR